MAEVHRRRTDPVVIGCNAAGDNRDTGSVGREPMSQALEVYLVPDERDLKIFGSRRRKLLKEVLQTATEALGDLDEEFDVAEEGVITHAEALKEIFAGKLTREDDCGYI